MTYEEALNYLQSVDNSKLTKEELDALSTMAEVYEANADNPDFQAEVASFADGIKARVEQPTTETATQPQAEPKQIDILQGAPSVVSDIATQGFPRATDIANQVYSDVKGGNYLGALGRAYTAQPAMAMDILSAPQRALMSGLGGTQSMATTEVEAPSLFSAETAKNIALDPMNLVPMGGLSNLAKIGVSKFATNPLLQKFLGRAFEGAGQGAIQGGVYGATESGRGNDASILGSTLGGALGGGIIAPIAGAGADVVGAGLKKVGIGLSEPEKVAQKTLKEYEGLEGMPEQSREALQEVRPEYRFAFRDQKEGDIPYTELVKRASESRQGLDVADPLEMTYAETVKPAIDGYKAFTSDIGAQIGDIREKYLPQTSVLTKSQVLNKFKETLDNKKSAYRLSDDGQFIDRNGRAISDVPDELQFLKSKIDKMEDQVNGVDLDLLRENLGDYLKKSTSTIRPQTQVENYLESFNNDLKDQIDQMVEDIAIQDDLEGMGKRFKDLRKEYAKRKPIADLLDKKLGQIIESGVDESGQPVNLESVLRRTVQSGANAGIRSAMEAVSKDQGVDIGRSVARTLQALSAVGDVKSSDLRSNLKEMAMNKLKGAITPDKRARVASLDLPQKESPLSRLGYIERAGTGEASRLGSEENPIDLGETIIRGRK